MSTVRHALAVAVLLSSVYSHQTWMASPAMVTAASSGTWSSTSGGHVRSQHVGGEPVVGCVHRVTRRERYRLGAPAGCRVVEVAPARRQGSRALATSSGQLGHALRPNDAHPRGGAERRGPRRRCGVVQASDRVQAASADRVSCRARRGRVAKSVSSPTVSETRPRAVTGAASSLARRRHRAGAMAVARSGSGRRRHSGPVPPHAAAGR